MKPGSIKTSEFIAVLLILMALSIGFYHAHIQKFPSHVHAWTQSDRYALAIGFVENGMNPLLPSTPNLYPKYPPKNGLTTYEGITRVDFPLIEYLSAVAMKMANSKHPSIFRLIVLTIGLIGLLYLFAFFRLLGSTFFLSLLMTIFTFTAPVFTYYLNGFIPSIPALAFSFAAFYYYLRYLQENKIQKFILSLIFLTLAALIRMPFLMPLIAVFIVQIVYSRNSNGKTLFEISLLMAALLTVISYLIYNNYLGNKYGSMFISHLMPASGMNQFFELASQAWNKWMFHYFSLTHYAIIGVAAFLYLYYFIKKPRLDGSEKLVFISVLTLGAAVLFLSVMVRQFPDHDYYLLDSFFLPIVLFIGIGFSHLKISNKFMAAAVAICAFMVSALMIRSSAKIQSERYTTHPWDRTEMTRLNFQNSAEWLDENNISPQARLLVLDAYTSNVPLILMERNGFTVINTSKKEIESALSLPFDFIVTQNRTLFSDVIRNFPLLARWLVPVANNEKIGLYTLDYNAEQKSLFQLVAPNDTTKRQLIDYPFERCLRNGEAFLPLLDTLITLNEEGSWALVFESTAFSASRVNEGLHFVLDISNTGGYHYYDSSPISSFFENTTKENSIQVFMNIPSKNTTQVKLKCYLWNPGNSEPCFQFSAVYLLKYQYSK